MSLYSKLLPHLPELSQITSQTLHQLLTDNTSTGIIGKQKLLSTIFLILKKHKNLDVSLEKYLLGCGQSLKVLLDIKKYTKLLLDIVSNLEDQDQTVARKPRPKFQKLPLVDKLSINEPKSALEQRLQDLELENTALKQNLAKSNEKNKELETIISNIHSSTSNPLKNRHLLYRSQILQLQRQLSLYKQVVDEKQEFVFDCQIELDSIIKTLDNIDAKTLKQSLSKLKHQLSKRPQYFAQEPRQLLFNTRYTTNYLIDNVDSIDHVILSRLLGLEDMLLNLYSELLKFDLDTKFTDFKINSLDKIIQELMLITPLIPTLNSNTKNSELLNQVEIDTLKLKPSQRKVLEKVLLMHDTRQTVLEKKNNILVEKLESRALIFKEFSQELSATLKINETELTSSRMELNGIKTELQLILKRVQELVWDEDSVGEFVKELKSKLSLILT